METCVINERGLVVSVGWLADPTTRLCRSLSTPSPISTHYYCGHTSPRKLQLLLTQTSALSGTPPTENSSWCYQHKQTFKAEGIKVPTINHCSADTFWPSRWMTAKGSFAFTASRVCVRGKKKRGRKRARERRSPTIKLWNLVWYQAFIYTEGISAGRIDQKQDSASFLCTQTQMHTLVHTRCVCAQSEIREMARWIRKVRWCWITFPTRQSETWAMLEEQEAQITARTMRQSGNNTVSFN